MLDKYVALYASELIDQDRYSEATAVFEKYGAPWSPQNLDMYKKLFKQVGQTVCIASLLVFLQE